MLLEQATILAREGQYKPDLARSLMTLGRARLKLGEVGLATELLMESLSRFQDIGNKLGIAITLEALASVRLTQQDSAGAVRLYAAAHNLRRVLGAPLPPIDHDVYNSAIAATRAQLGDDVFTDLWAHAAAAPFIEVVEEILMASDAVRRGP